MISQEHSLKKLKRILKNWKDEEYLFNYSNKKYDIIHEQYQERTGKTLNILEPSSYSEKLQWLKLFWKDEKAYLCADKHSMRQIVEEEIGKDYLNDQYFRWTNVNEIDISNIPVPCILKASHASGFNVVITNKETLNIYELKQMLNQVLKIHYYAAKCEWVYEKAQPSILCEPLFEHKGQKIDYKFYCFDGKVKMVHILNAMDYHEKNVEPKAFLVDRAGKPIDAEYGYETENINLEIPKDFEKMVSIAEQLSTDFPHVRIDLFKIDAQIHVGEFTFFPGAGYDLFNPDSYDYVVGKWLNLPAEKG